MMRKLIIFIFALTIISVGTLQLLVSAPVFDVKDIQVKGKTISFNTDIVKKWVRKMGQSNNKMKVERADIEILVEEFLLSEKTTYNPHLRFKDGDISYWVKQCRKYGLDEEDLRREFAARRAVLEAADMSGVVIDTQGDLSHAAEEIMADMIRAKIFLDTQPKK